MLLAKKMFTCSMIWKKKPLNTWVHILLQFPPELVTIARDDVDDEFSKVDFFGIMPRCLQGRITRRSLPPWSLMGAKHKPLSANSIKTQWGEFEQKKLIRKRSEKFVSPLVELSWAHLCKGTLPLA